MALTAEIASSWERDQLFCVAMRTGQQRRPCRSELCWICDRSSGARDYSKPWSNSHNPRRPPEIGFRAGRALAISANVSLNGGEQPGHLEVTGVCPSRPGPGPAGRWVGMPQKPQRSASLAGGGAPQLGHGVVPSHTPSCFPQVRPSHHLGFPGAAGSSYQPAGAKAADRCHRSDPNQDRPAQLWRPEADRHLLHRPASPEADAGPAKSSSLDGPVGVAVDAHGNLFIADTGNNLVEEVTAAGRLSVVAGNGKPGRPTPGPATRSARLWSDP